MIGMLSGVVYSKNNEHVLLNTASGIGFVVKVPSRLLSILHVGLQVYLYTECLIKDDNITLFGFESVADQECFRQLIKARGISGKYALRIMGALTTGAIAKAIKEKDVALLSSVPGVGKKTAFNLVTELSGSTDLFVEHAINKVMESAISALCNLGHSEVGATKIVQEVYALDNNLSLSDLIKKSLQQAGI